MNDENNKAKKLGHKLGYLLAVIAFGCLAALLVALTIKCIIWMF